MLQNTWYAVGWSRDIDTQPKKLKLNNLDVLLVRNELKQVQAFHAYCPHRGCDLSLGHFDGQLLTCPFHGWQFQQDGQCVNIPANRTQQFFPSASLLRTYTVIEKYGLVWVNLNQNAQIENESFNSFAELDVPEWVRVPFRKTWQAHFTRVVESVLDVSHLPFVHPETTGQDANPVVNPLEVTYSKDGICIYPTPYVSTHPMEPPVEGAVQGIGRTSTERTSIELKFPNQWMIRTPLGDGMWMMTFLAFTPIDEQATAIYGFVMRNFDHESEFLNLFHLEHTEFIMGQDQRIIESIRPYQAPFHLHQEVHVSSDTPTIRFRVMLREALKKEGTIHG